MLGPIGTLWASSGGMFLIREHVRNVLAPLLIYKITLECQELYPRTLFADQNFTLPFMGSARNTLREHKRNGGEMAVCMTGKSINLFIKCYLFYQFCAKKRFMTYRLLFFFAFHLIFGFHIIIDLCV